MNRKRILHLLRLIVTGVVGGIVLLAGIVMLFVPGQGILTILLGLGILATEFPWAERLLKRMKERFKDAAHELRRRYHKHKDSDDEASPAPCSDAAKVIETHSEAKKD